MQQILDIVLHLDKVLAQVATDHPVGVYGLLCAIVFAETGFVITPFLPGDSLLFAVGLLSGTGALNIWIAAPSMLVCAIAGNTANYHIGKFVGPRIFRGEGSGFLSRLMSRKHLDRANAFYAKYGGKAVTLGQFVPIVRTFVPFIAGAGAMSYSRFIFFNVTGAIAWVGICTAAGYFLGKIDIVRDNFSIAILLIIAVSLIPVAIEFIKSKRARPSSAASAPSPAPSK